MSGIESGPATTSMDQARQAWGKAADAAHDVARDAQTRGAGLVDEAKGRLASVAGDLADQSTGSAVTRPHEAFIPTSTRLPRSL